MLSKTIGSRLALAAVVSVAVVALMAASVGTVQAVAAQDQQEDEKASQSEQERELRSKHRERRARGELELHVAREALQRAREMGGQGRLRMVQELRQRDWAPGVEYRRLGSRFGGGMADRVLARAEEIELTDQQETQIRDARRAQRRAEIERDAQIEVLDLDLEELLEDRHTADLNAVEAVMQQRASLRVQGQVADMRASQGVWNVLTSEQQKDFEEGRHSFFVRRGDRPHAMFFDGEGGDIVFDGGDFEVGDFEFGELFNDLHLEGLEGLDGLKGLLELKSEGGGPFMFRYKMKPDEDADEDAEKKKKEKGSTEGTAVGVSWAGQSTRTMK